MLEAEKFALAIFGGIITLAIISVIISPKSKAVQAIQALSGGLANVVNAAANPVATAATNGNPEQNSFSMPLGISQDGSDVMGALGIGGIGQLAK